MCQCFQIGGPFISEDPDCPVHGSEAQAHEREEENLWDAKFVVDGNMMDLIRRIVQAKAIGAEAEVRQLMRQAVQVQLIRSEDDDADYAEQKIREIVLFFSKLEQ